MSNERPGQKAAEISPEKLALLVKRLKKKAAEGSLSGEIQRRAGEGSPPLSFAQQRLWLLDRLEPGGSAYSIPSFARLTGDLDPAALASALAEIRRRHEALRTTFTTIDGVPVQVIAPPGPATPEALPLVDLSALPEAAGRREGHRLLAAEAKTPFDLETGPLWRFTLVRLAPAEHLLMLNVHHTVADGWSLGLFFNELSALYAASREGRPSPLPAPPIQYSDFAVWQRERLQGSVLEEQLAYWREQLAGSPPALELPTDRLRPAVPTHRGEALPLRLPASLTLALRELSRREGTSLFMTLLAGFYVLLSRLTGQEDVVVGAPSAGRSRVETEGLIGLFLNTLVLRTDLSGAASFQELLARVSSVVLGAYRYQDVPFEKLLEELQPERVLSRSPFFQVLFNMVSLPDAPLAMPGLQVEPIELAEPDAKLDFTLYLQERGDVIDGNLVYSTDLFDQPRMQELLRQLELILSQAVAAPAASLGALSLVTPAARALLPEPAAPLGGEWMGPIHAAAGRWAARTPARPAVEGWREGEVWSYAELDARSNQLAHFLRAGGVQTGDVVAVWAHRGASLAWAVLAALKAGAAIMILDPAYPPGRLVDYLSIGRPRACLTVTGATSPPDEVDRALPALRLELPPLPAIPADFLAGFPATDPAVSIGPDDAACITFTSGSTGMPKAVVGRHGPLSHFYPWMGERFGLSENDRFGMLSALSHDPLQRDLFTPLWFGAALSIPEPDRLGAPRYLADWIRRQEVSVLHLTPAMMELVTLAAEEAPVGERELPSLRRAFVVGDLLKKADVARLQRLAPGLTCVNLYGSTETQRSVGYFAVPRPEAPEWARLGREVLPLGQGIEDVQLLVLNPASGLAGIGELGEIHVRSRHLARGYLGDEGLTAARFLVNPWRQEADRQEAGDRIYRTGDLGRYLPDGNVEFAGRADSQVKVRGFRIELGEIEAALARFPGVKDCVVVVREDRAGDPRLAAYVVAAEAPAARDLHAFLARRLPDYMVPSDFVTLAALPLTATGKVDRRALPAPVREESGAPEPHELHPVEELLAGIWADLLGAARVGRRDDFFALGGHSLLATRMISRVRAVLGVDLPLRAVFEEPTLAGFAVLVEEARQGSAGAGLPQGPQFLPMVRVPRGGPLPASFSQQRFWFLDRLEPGSFAYNLAGAVRLEGALDVVALAAALGGIVRRHESLRTTFVEADGDLGQVIAAPAALPLPVVDLTRLRADQREEEARRVAIAEARRPYDLARGPLVRTTLLRLSEREHALLIGMHHIVSDGWSLGLFVREWEALYGALAAGEAAALPELTIQYGDFAVWQRQWLTGEVLAERLAWWTRQLAGAPKVVELPLDRTRPAVQSYRGGQVRMPLGSGLTQRLEGAARRLGVTPFMLLLGGFAALLSRYGGQDDVVVGSPVANRGRAELEELIGLFVNTLALRVDLGGDPGFDELARRLREVTLGAYAHQDVPFERLVDELRPERDLSHAPVFQVMLVLQNLPISRLSLPGLTLSPLELETGRTQYDLSLFLLPQEGGGLLARLEYARDLFDPATVERLLGHWGTLLEAVVDGPATRVSMLPLLTAGERAQLAAWDEAAPRRAAGGLLHALFEAQAQRTPEAPALVAGDLRLTYAELAERSAELAARLRTLGAGPEVGVAVCLERTADLVVTLLAVLRAGAFYVPLDPRYPQERLRFLLEDSGARILVAGSGLAAGLPMPETGCLRQDLETVGAVVPANGNAEVTAQNLAYLIYTSGSTGRPKAVAIAHQSAVELAFWARDAFSAAELEGVLASTAVTFDLSVFEIFVPLAWGGTVVLAGNALELPAVAGALPPGTGITLVNTVPSAMAELLRDGGLPASVRTVGLAGEALPRWLADRAYARPGIERLCNLYGPSEDTTYSTWAVVERSAERPPSIGRPVSGTRAYVLDPGLERLPVGVAGELFLSGAGLARGYLGRPELTAERFLPDPFAAFADSGARMYRTGDLVRLRPDGELEYLGRLDHQVKVRGFRIELGEVEDALVRLPGVESAVVLAREDAPGDKRLVAYVVAAGAEPAVAELRSALEQSLPEPYIPSAFVFLAALPLTPHGKVDRRALPAPVADRHDEVERSRERSPAEELLAGIWADLLKVPGMASQDNFFELGGHSLLATRVVSRVREVFGVELPLRALFETPTLAGLAARIQAAQHQGLGPQAPPLRPLPAALRDGELQASFAQERLWFLDRFGTDRSSYNVPAAIRLSGRLDVPALAACLTEIARRHETLRTTFQVTGGAKPRVLQVVAPPRELPLPVADLAALPEAEREAEAVRLAREEARRVFDLERGPLVRATLARLGEREHTLLLSMHHIVADGWSIGVLVRELSALYSSSVQGQPSPLPELPVQYADFAAWQRSWLQGEVLEAQLGWWRERLAGAPAVIELPADRPRPPVQRARGGRLAYALPEALSQELQALVRAEGATLFMALLAGFQTLLARTTGGEDLPIGTPIANRNRVEIEELIGFFVNTLVLRGDLSGDPSFRELLRRSREAALGAYAHQDVPFEKLVEELRPERDLSHAPLFQAMVILQNAPPAALELPDLTVVPQSADGGTAKFDLRLSLQETPAGLIGSLVYNRDLFDDATVARLGSYLETLLAAAVAHPELPLSGLPLLGETERHQLLAWGDARPAAFDRDCLHRVFEAQAARAPERPAVTCSGESLSYRELDARSNRLARFLVEAGVRPGSLVGLCLERSLDMVVAILGVLKAGGAYLPLDPTYPQERLAFAIADSRIAVIVTEESVAADLPAHGAREVRLDGDREAIAAQSAVSLEIEVTPELPAYVIYTSGSTGRPKGVVVSHANASRLFSATEAWFNFGGDDVWTLFHSYAFDFSVWELWGALLYGGRLVVVPYWVSRSPQAFYELVRDERVTVLNQTPSAFRQLIWAEESLLTSLRYVIFGGEALELASLAPWMERHGDEQPRLVNMYGITETTVHVTYRPLSRGDVAEARGSVLGVPIPDLSLRVLDRHLSPQPVGAPGEIHVGGAGLAQGYLGRPELTAERFVPDPFGEPGARLYKSGDLARYLADGDLEYLGRIDHQVKIRGFRIELGEIETALTSQAEIREAVVLAREDAPGEKRLVAYVVANLLVEAELPAGELRDRLKAKLPEYMVPSAFVTLSSLPLTANGKVDRKALPAPEATAAAPARERVAPRSELERFLAELWRTVPGAPAEIGIGDDFFELGGNSITGALLINRLQAALGEIVHVVAIFDAPTIESMAAYLRGNHPEAVARIWGEDSLGSVTVRGERVDEARVAQMRGLIRPLSPLAHSGPKNRPAIFVLAPPRSGTTLMRVMLGGHPRLFAPPELELLSYNTLAERLASYTGRDAFWLEGLVRAVMEIRGCTAEEATEITERWAAEEWTARRVYGQLQEWLGERTLVDKTPSYALDESILQRAEEDFAEPLYVHLVRHPYGMIRSFEEAKLDQIFFRQEHPFGRRELAELIWQVSQENVLRFLETVPSRRWHRVHFEDLLREPEVELRRLCGFLGLDFDPAMVRPYEDRGRRMTDGIHAESRMLGDVKFHTYSGIEASTAERWREAYQEDFLGVPTAEMAKTLGYDVQVARSAAGIPRRAWRAGELRPVSFAQQRLWFLDRLEPGSFAYNLAGAVRLAGPLDAAALAGALSSIVGRHESLRTTFAEMDGEPRQVIAEAVPLPLPLLDLSALPAAAREAEARRVATAEAGRPYDLSRGPLARFALLRLDERQHALLFGMHHIVSDGWSMGLFVGELGALYRSRVTGEEAAVPALPIQYSDFAAWQRESLAGAVLEEQIGWWTRRLAGAPQVVELPLDRPRPAVRSARGAVTITTFGEGLETRLEALSRRLGVTPFMALLAGFATLLSRYGGQTDVVVGSPIANRGRSEVEDLIGFFANTLALRVDLAGDPTFAELAGRVREMALGAYARQDVPFEHLVNELRPERNLSHTPVFQVVLALQNIPRSDLNLAGLTLSRLEFDTGQSQFDLSLFLSPQADGGLRAWVAYARDLFDAGTVQRLLGHFNRLLAAVAGGGEGTCLSALPLMDLEERQQVLHQWNDTATAYPREATIPGLFEEQARRAPDALAVVDGGKEVTYAELNRRAEHLAGWLVAAGLQPDEAVGLCAERSADLVAALLGTLKAGGAYVPLDPTYPRERLAGMLADTRARIVVVQEGFEDALPEMSRRGEVRLPLRGSLAAEGGTTARPALHPEQLAYVSFTSGSTGRPKGVMVSHRNVVRLVRETDYAHFGPDEVFLQLAPVAFDASTLEIWGPLLNGGRLAVYPPGPLDLRELGDALERHGVTYLFLTSGLFHQMVESHLDRLRPLRHLTSGGDVLSPDLVRRAVAGLPGMTFTNAYGPTEGTTFTTCHPLRSTADLGAGSVPIGRPIANTRVYLLDGTFRPVPVGVMGQLYAAGDGLARGYAGRPDLTAERFVPDPVSGEPGARLYATGDLARWRPSGEIEFLGRADAQVKIRGFRIEPGEIEAVLATHPEVETPLVLVREDEPGERRLVAYVVAAPGCALEPAELRSWLAQRLPSYMVPAAFVVLAELPLGPTGKVDRRALPAPAMERREAEPAGERSPVEELLAGIWADLLKVPGVASQDSFFELGGHSLLATRVVSRVREVFGVELPLRNLFEEPTLAGLAARIQAAQRQGLGVQAPPIRPIPPALRGELQASFAQERLWFLDRFGTDRSSYNVPFAIRLSGRLDVPALAACLTEIVRRHETLRTTFRVTGGTEPRVLQVIAQPRELPLSITDLAALPEAEREAEAVRLTREEARRVFDLERGPLVRATLARLGEREHTLLFTRHHIIADGWSNGVLMRELSVLYSAFAQGQPSPLPDLPVQYADFAAWQRGWLQGEVLEAQLGWWREQLAGAPAVIELPADRPRPPVQSARGGRLDYALPAALSQGLQALVRAEGATLFMALLAGFQTLLARTTGGEDLPVGTPIANRNRAEIEELIGFFVNTLVLRGDLSGDPSFRELLARSREVALGAYAHQDLPFEKLVEELRPERDVSHSPLFQAMVILQNAHREVLELPGLTARPLDAGIGAAKFDLRLSLLETPAGLAGTVVYNRDLFDDATVARLGSYLETLLSAAVAHPELPLSALPLLGETERQQLLAWGDARPAAFGRACLHQVFAAQAARAPERPAVTCSGESLSYRELDARSNRLARFLVEAGVLPGSLVGLCLERSLDMVVAILGVLKAGGAYLPLDPTYPQERLAFAIADSRIAVIVTEESVAADLPAHGAREVRLDGDREAIERQSAESLAVEMTPDFPAYVIYTSGSTGRPKGVVVSHANASRLFSATEAWFNFGADDVWTLFHSYAFDFSVWELWGALLYGGRLVVVPYWVSRSPQAFYELVRDEGVTVLNQTPSAFRQLIWAEESLLTSLRYVIFGGEALELASLAPWMERHGDERPQLVNMYGITETTVHVTYRPLSRGDVEQARGSVLGVPIPDLSLRVLDRHLSPQPIGVPGEIHVGGAGLAQGYLGRPELTAERFVPDPFGEPGARLYKSGDLARYLADGDLEYLGRIDHQVKIRGFRIELGEIETALTSQPEIREAVVLAREDASGEKRLVAYVVANLLVEAELSAGELRDRLKAKLPEYMVPSAFVTLASLPLTSNGKVDRKALPAPEAAAAAPARERVAPRTELERFLAELWRTVPGASAEIGIGDDFFELGGNSITGALLINRLQATLGEIVHVVVIFDAPTIERMAAYLIENHPGAVARIWGEESLGGAAVGGERAARVDEARVAQMRGLIRPLPALARSGPKNPPAVFVLAPPRSGTTLMRVMLGGHPRLFAPPELELLSYNTLAERRASYTGRDAFWLEGLVRAVMEVRGCTAEEATEITDRWADEAWTARQAYGQLQEWLGGRILVDKTPSYALDPSILERAEEDFTEPLYVHLVRHPYGMIRSFEEAKLDQIFFRQEHPFGRRELAELIWQVSQENILRFLETVPSRRWHRVHFEDLLREPEVELRRLCGFLGLDFDPAMVRPYEDRGRRMTDGIHAESRMLGDVKFHTYSGIEASTAERWREAYQEDFLGVPTAEMARTLGYDVQVSRSAAVIPRRAWQVGELRPVSFAQQRLWFLDRLEPGGFAYNLAGAVRLAGSLDAGALAGALSGIVGRHESLRTTFVEEEDGEPRQSVAEAVPLPLPLLDLSGLPAAAREEEIRRIGRAETRRPYDLSRGPLVRFALLRLDEREHVLLVGMHHIVSDGWSMGIFVRELGVLYRALATGEPAALPELPIQYGDFAAWQREHLTGQVMEERLGWWTQRLSGAPQVTELPLDRPRPAVRSHRGANAVAKFEGLEHRLEALSRRLGVTPFMTLMAGFTTLLSRYGGQTDVVVGTPIANRAHAEVEDLIGFFANTLALRVDLAGEPTFAELAGRVQTMALGAYGHQDVPFELLVNELRPERNLSHSPVFQVLMALQNTPKSALDLAGLTLSRVELDVGRSQFDLAFFLSPQADGGLYVLVDYAQDLFEAATVQRLLGHFHRLLEAAVAPGGESARITELPLLTAAERAQLVRWDQAERRGHPEGLLHSLFEAQAQRTPEALALVAGSTLLTYAELAERSAELAARLRALGAAPEVGVAVCLERTADLIVTLLAVLRAGSFYVPLDPQYPEERLRFLLADSGARILVARNGLAAALPAPETRCVRLDLEDAGAIGPAASGAEVSGTVTARNLAYLIYTSGSTGRPKAVAIEHRSAVAFAFWARESFSAEELRGVLASTAVTFDLSVFEIFVTLAWGGTVVLAQNALELPEVAAGLPSGVEITLVNTVPSAMAELLREDSLPKSVRTINLAGEALPRWLADRAYARPETARLCNLYGPSEDTTYSTWTVVERDTERAPAIGRPVHDTRAYVLDPRLERLPVGIPGELCLAGAGLARGYLGRPELTAERFLPDPFGDPSADPGARMYRTGDLVRLRPDGELEYLGRLDHQVKVRGYRIELGEVEAALAGQPGVESAVVLAREDVPGEKRLVAYVVASGAEPAVAELRGVLKESLPEPYIPSAFVFLAAFPLTPHGKVDRRALPAPDASRRETAAELVAPRNPLEEALAAVWTEVLRRGGIGIHDNFFELGGDSIRTIQVVARSRKRGILITARLVFQHQTIAELAAVAQVEERRAEPEIVPENVPIPSDAGGFTPSDFPVSGLDQGELDELLALLGQSVE